MQVTETLAEGLKREFKIVLSAAEIEEKMKTRLEEVGRSVRVPGFRPGKIPPHILKQRFGPAVMGEVLEKSVNESSQEALAERDLKPALQPKIEVTAFDEGKDLEYNLSLELMPEITPMEFSDVELERIKVEIPDDEVEQAIERLANQQRQTAPLETERKTQSGDVVVIDFKGSVDGESLPGMAGEDHHLELGTNAFIAGFEEQLTDLDKGAEKTVTVNFPDDFANEKLAGREAVFEVTVKDILQTVPTEINDELAKTFGADDLASLRARVRESLAGEYDKLSHGKLKRELLDKLAEAHDFEVPEGMIDIEFDAIWQQVEADRQAGRSDPDDEGKDEETLKTEYRDIAVRRVRLGLLLAEIGQKNGIEVDNEELQRALFEEAQRHPGHQQEVIKFYQDNPASLANLRGPIFEDKVIDFIVDLAKVSERALSPEELQKVLEAESESEAADKAEKPKKPAAKKTAAKKSAAKKTAAKKPAAKKAAAKKAPAKKAASKKPAADAEDSTS
jgi:trigger factor